MVRPTNNLTKGMARGSLVDVERSKPANDSNEGAIFSLSYMVEADQASSSPNALQLGLSIRPACVHDSATCTARGFLNPLAGRLPMQIAILSFALHQ